jgi:ArsR family transcriptional regulator, lead/cadmium/zinc/bismuth-responsive transcriptional repressor
MLLVFQWFNCDMGGAPGVPACQGPLVVALPRHNSGSTVNGRYRKQALQKTSVAGNRMESMRGRVRIGEDQVVELAEMFRLMSDPTRLKIILACLDAAAAVGEMAERLGISASLVSHHLRLLRAARLLQADRRGRQVFYAVQDEHIRSMLSDMVDHVAEVDAEAEGGG